MSTIPSSSQVKRGGSFLGTRWQVRTGDQDESITISWPTLFIAAPIGFFGTFLCVIFSVAAAFEAGPMVNRWPLMIAGYVICIFAIASLFLLRENLIVDSRSASRSVWPAFLRRPRQAVPADSIVNALIELKIHYGKNTRRFGIIHLRVRRPDGIAWWPIGSDLSWNQSKKLGRVLSRLVEVRVDQQEE